MIHKRNNKKRSQSLRGLHLIAYAEDSLCFFIHYPWREWKSKYLCNWYWWLEWSSNSWLQCPCRDRRIPYDGQSSGRSRWCRCRCHGLPDTHLACPEPGVWYGPIGEGRRPLVHRWRRYHLNMIERQRTYWWKEGSRREEWRHGSERYTGPTDEWENRDHTFNSEYTQSSTPA